MRTLAAAVAVVLLVAATTGAQQQSSFRVTYAPGRTTATSVEIKGVVLNEARTAAADVSVTVEALDAGGKVVARGVSYVASRIAEHGTASFAAKVPIVPGIASYRASVTSFRFVQGLQNESP